MWVNKLIHESKLRVATWNIGTLTGKSMDLIDIIIRQRRNIICLQETKGKSKELEGPVMNFGVQVKINKKMY